jgi:hypothetical protein
MKNILINYSFVILGMKNDIQLENFNTIKWPLNNNCALCVHFNIQSGILLKLMGIVHQNVKYLNSQLDNIIITDRATFDRIEPFLLDSIGANEKSLPIDYKKSVLEFLHHTSKVRNESHEFCEGSYKKERREKFGKTEQIVKEIKCSLLEQILLLKSAELESYDIIEIIIDCIAQNPFFEKHITDRARQCWFYMHGDNNSNDILKYIEEFIHGFVSKLVYKC